MCIRDSQLVRRLDKERRIFEVDINLTYPAILMIWTISVLSTSYTVIEETTSPKASFLT